MKSRTLTLIIAITLFAALVLPVQLAAQQTRYRPIDLGTFGGPSSFVNSPESFETARVLNNAGTVVGLADTSVTDTSPSPFFPFDGFNSHAFRWRKGVLTDLGALPGGNNSIALWISASGLIVGLSENGLVDPLLGFLEVNAFLWRDGQVTNLGTLEGGHESAALSVNSRGQVVGVFFNSIPDPFEFGFQEKAFLWQNGVMQDLGTLGGPNARASYINERGQILGHSDVTVTTNPSTGGRTDHAFLWENGTMLDLRTVGGTLSFEAALNNRGQAVGGSSLPGDPGCLTPDGCQTHPFLWGRGVLTDLGTLGGDFAGAVWINDAGEVIASSTTPGNQALHSFLWKHGVITDLGTVGGDICTFARSINSQGQVVGLSNDCLGGIHIAFLWEKGGPMIDLNTRIAANSGVKLADAFSINDRGEIVTAGLLPNGDTHMFLLIPCGGGDAQTKGCENSGEDATAVTPNHSAASNEARPTPKEVVAAFHAELNHRNPGFRLWPRR